MSEACRTFGVHRSTYYAWRRRVERHGLEILRPRERRPPKMPNALSAMVEERVLSFAIAHPGLGPRRVASELGREKWGAISVSHATVRRVLRRHGLSTRARRCALAAGYRAPHEPSREPERHESSMVRKAAASLAPPKRRSGSLWGHANPPPAA